MRGNRAIYGMPLPADTSTEWICNQINVKTPRELITELAIKTIHRIITTQNPPEIFKKIRFFRKVSVVKASNGPRTTPCRRFSSINLRSLEMKV